MVTLCYKSRFSCYPTSSHLNHLSHLVTLYPTLTHKVTKVTHKRDKRDRRYKVWQSATKMENVASVTSQTSVTRETEGDKVVHGDKWDKAWHSVTRGTKCDKMWQRDNRAKCAAGENFDTEEVRRRRKFVEIQWNVSQILTYYDAEHVNYDAQHNVFRVLKLEKSQNFEDPYVTLFDFMSHFDDPRPVASRRDKVLTASLTTSLYHHTYCIHK